MKFSPMRSLWFKQLGASVALGVLLCVPMKPAHATIPPCETAECPVGAKAWWALHATVVTLELALLEVEMWLLLEQGTDAITRLANQTSMNTQVLNNADAATTDMKTANDTATALADKVNSTNQDLEPSTSVCTVVSRRNRVTTASFSARQQISAREYDATNLMTNAPNTIGENGRVGYLSERYRVRMQRYCDPATVQPAAGVTCAATVGINRDLFPYESIWKQSNLATANDYTAAKDVVYNLMGAVVADPIRGAALDRDEGRNLSLTRGAEVARLNVASSALMAMVERRRDVTGKGLSEVYMLRQASFIDSSMESLAEANAAQMQPQNLKTISALVGEGTRNIFAIRNFIEQWSAIRAVSLAMDVRQSSTTVSAAGRAIDATLVAP